MGLEAHERTAGATPVSTGDDTHALNGIWIKSAPSTETTSNPRPVDSTVTPPTDSNAPSSDVKSPASAIAHEENAPVFTDSDGKPLTNAKLAGMRYSDSMDKPVIELAAMALPNFPSFENKDVTKVSDKAHSAKRRPTADDLSRVAHAAVGSDQYGKKVPSTASEFRNMDVPKNLKCASTSSEWLVAIGVITNKDYKIRVDDMIELLPQKGFKKVHLEGDLDLNKFPDGPIGFITGQKRSDDGGSNHIGFIEKRDGQLRVIHNNFRTGAVVDQDIKEKFYTADGKPEYREMNMFIFPKR